MSLKSLSFRFTVRFAGIFVAGSLLLAITTYAFLANSLRREDSAEIRSRLLEFWAIYQTGKIDLIRKELTLERLVMEERLYMLRIAGRYNNTLYLYVPARWTYYNLGRLETLSTIREGEIIALRSDEDRDVLEVSSLKLPDGNILQLGISTKRRQEVLQRFRRTFILVFLPLAGLGLLGGFLFSSRSLKPVRHLIEVTRGIIDTGRMNARVPSRGSADELDELVGLFNRMLVKIDSLITGMRQSLDNVAHDLRTPMTHLRGTAELALQGAEAIGAYQEALASCMEESERILNMLSTLMDISEAETGVMKLDRKTIDLSSLVDDMVELYSYSAEEKNITLTREPGESIPISADLNRIRQVIVNLLDNAIKYTPQNGSITVSAGRQGQEAVVTIHDTGPGIPPKDLPHIWDRLFRGDQSRSQPGLGLGLGLVRAIVHAHGGEVGVESKPGEGSSFIVHLPLSVVLHLPETASV
jgi:heavy metal sensor kinase